MILRSVTFCTMADGFKQRQATVMASACADAACTAAELSACQTHTADILRVAGLASLEVDQHGLGLASQWRPASCQGWRAPQNQSLGPCQLSSLDEKMHCHHV